MTRQISVHTGKFLENFRKHGRAVPAPSRSPHRLARWAERRTRMTRMRDKKAFPPSRVACSCVWSTDAVRVCTRWCVRLVTGDRRVCVSVRVYTNGSDTHYICSLAALRQANFGKFSRAARAAAGNSRRLSVDGGTGACVVCVDLTWSTHYHVWHHTEYIWIPTTWILTHCLDSNAV